jgi:hypothetical protein
MRDTISVRGMGIKQVQAPAAAATPGKRGHSEI